ncbi:MAG TPA: transposase [Gemmataceae bacterium]|nr:transposase [Gemmataceae bacterium]
MSKPSLKPWNLTDAEWLELSDLLVTPLRSPLGGRPRIDETRSLAEACHYRLFHSQQVGYRCFGWNHLPKRFGVSPSTANRRFREWSANGSWHRFWHALLAFRKNAPAWADISPEMPLIEPHRVPKSEFANPPISKILNELERAYQCFNTQFYVDSLPRHIAIVLEPCPQLCRGYFCSRMWKIGNRKLDHIALSYQSLGAEVNDTLAVLLHEMVHLRNSLYGIRDCNHKNQYHNRYFRDIANLSGLTCAGRDTAHGYARTYLSDAGQAAITAIDPNRAILKWKFGK